MAEWCPEAEVTDTDPDVEVEPEVLEKVLEELSSMVKSSDWA